MSRSMWVCSGKHWLRTAAVWSVFALTVSLAVEAGADPGANPGIDSGIDSGAEPAANSAPIELRLEATAPNPVTLRLTFLDLARLDVEAFGDEE